MCDDTKEGKEPSDVSAFVQAPLYLLQSIVEICSQIATIEYAFGEAPDNMKSIMQAVISSFGSVRSLL